MMFLFAVPVMGAMALYLVPLMIGTREIAFPRLAAFNYWVLLFGVDMIYIGLFLNIAPDAGWFSYVPLAGPEYSPGKRSDFWAQMVTFTELSALGISVLQHLTLLGTSLLFWASLRCAAPPTERASSRCSRCSRPRSRPLCSARC